MIDPKTVAEMGQHFAGAELQKKVAELTALADPARCDRVQRPLRTILVKTIKEYALSQEQAGDTLAPYDLTLVLLDVLGAHVCGTRDKRLTLQVIITQMTKAFVTKLIEWHHRVTREESKTQPGG
jgi:hypothetical protein